MLRSTAEIIEGKREEGRTIPVIWAAGGFLIGLLAAALWSLEASLAPFEPIEPPPISGAEAFPANSILSVADQVSGGTVAVARVAVPAPGAWVAVLERHEDHLGNALGATRVMGPSENVAIELLRATSPRSAYAIVLYRDDGDGIFSPTSDSLYIEYETGERVIAPFATK